MSIHWFWYSNSITAMLNVSRGEIKTQTQALGIWAWVWSKDNKVGLWGQASVDCHWPWLCRRQYTVSRIKITSGLASWPQRWHKDKAQGGPFFSSRQLSLCHGANDSNLKILLKQYFKKYFENHKKLWYSWSNES